MGSIAELAGSSMEAAGSLVQDTGSTIVDTLSFLPFHVVQVVWQLVFGVAGDLGSSMPV
ncbi:hypothetical protein [Dietzia sp. UBA5065]|jgi:hypothetical protein|uniref:hypothetical protein n=1 Tax=Dietzia sp. UBA5065 TaxID=1946422 RepID=UPI0025C62E32|nr:hypothetical protein [Dietzia sp. UBA5065]HMT49150.1 hypothetical protein [Dietzia sp.]